MAGCIRDDEFAARGREIAVGYVNGDALLAFGPQPVGEQRKINGPGGAIDAAFFHGGELIFVNGLGIVEQAPDERGFAVVHTASSGETQQILL